jgi:hypothetical protein
MRDGNRSDSRDIDAKPKRHARRRPASLAPGYTDEAGWKPADEYPFSRIYPALSS